MKLSLSLILLLCGAACTQPPAGPRLVWSDEFDYTGLPDTARWSYETGYLRNRELQYYTAQRPENARVENGLLILEARRDSALIDSAVRPITSASLTTRGRQSWTYGRFEIRAKVPQALGSWPAAWMLGEDIGDIGWPACGEIDLMEHVGYMPDTFHFNIHTQAFNHTIGTHKGRSVFMPRAADAFHVFAADWDSTRIRFYLDGNEAFTFEKPSDDPAEWPFGKPFYLILNLAFGGAWGGSKGTDPAALPIRYEIDYVRVYQ
ncbi:MAG: glycoside hydrolase family 16 protein [Bacteroidia bacterium]|nr:glycoside hydrolase family 16 protein [Bacteroidia bacterium]